MGRLPLHRLPRRRRRRAGQPQREAADPLLPRAGRGPPARAARPRACSTARSSSPAPTGLDFDALSQRIHPAEKRIRQLAESTPASFVAFDLLAHDDTLVHGDAVRAAAQDARRSCCKKAAPAGPPHAGHPGPRRGRRLVLPLRGRRARRRRGQGRRTCTTCPTSGSCSRSSTSARPTAWWRASARTRTAPAWARCCSASSTPPGRCTTSAWRRGSAWPAGASWSTSSSPTGRTR